jgi:hypothetical protein
MGGELRFGGRGRAPLAMTSFPSRSPRYRPRPSAAPPRTPARPPAAAAGSPRTGADAPGPGWRRGRRQGRAARPGGRSGSRARRGGGGTAPDAWENPRQHEGRGPLLPGPADTGRPVGVPPTPPAGPRPDWPPLAGPARVGPQSAGQPAHQRGADGPRLTSEARSPWWRFVP